MSDTQEIAQIRNKILGALLADARKASGKSVAECAELVGVSEADYSAFEAGQTSPTLPQLEVLAFFFHVPLAHFWGTETLAKVRQEEAVKATLPDFIALRDKIIGGTVRSLRDEAGMSLEQVSMQTKISAERLEAYERGQIPVPVQDLRLIASAFSVGLEELVDDHGSIGSWLRLQSEFDYFANLPDEMREFILKPINRSYLELAVRLSGLSVQRLRGIAEGLLDITY